MTTQENPLSSIPSEKLAHLLSQALSEMTGITAQVQLSSLALEGDHAAAIQLQVQFAPAPIEEGDTPF